MSSPFVASHQQLQCSRRNEHYSQNTKSQKIFQMQSPSSNRNRKLYSLTPSHNTRQEKNKKSQQRVDSSNYLFKRKQQQNFEQSENNGKSFQILMRQSLRRAQNIRDKNKHKILQMSENSSWWTQSARRVLHSQNQVTIENFAQLEGKKCKINSPKKNKSVTPQSKYRRTKSSQSKYGRKQQKQLNIIQDQEHKQLDINEGPIMALGLASRKRISKEEQNNGYYIIQTKHNNVTKIALSTNNCFILGLDNLANNNISNFGNQNNFIRVKKKAKQLVKKINYLQNQEHDRQEKLSQSKITSFKNNFAKNLSNKPNNFFSEKFENMSKSTRQVKNKFQQNFRISQNAKISGWEVNGGYEIQNNF